MKLEITMRCFQFVKSVGQFESNPRFVSTSCYLYIKAYKCFKEISCIITDHRWRKDCFKDQLLGTYSPAWPMIQVNHMNFSSFFSKSKYMYRIFCHSSSFETKSLT